MPKFRKRPVVIEAHQWFKNGDHPQDCRETFTRSDGSTFQGEGKVVRYYRTPAGDGETPCSKCGVRMHEHGWIDTLEGGHIVCPGDWIITGVENEKYPCKAAIFEKTYEPVDATPVASTMTVTEWTLPKKGPGCAFCHGRGEVIFMIDRPGGPPGNQTVPCPKCGPK